MTETGSGQLDVLDWRRHVHALYAAVRTIEDPREAHRVWTRGREALLRFHPSSPVPAEDRDRYRGPRIASYNEAFRFVVPVDPAPRTQFEVETGTDGLVRFERVGVVSLKRIGTLDVWWLTSYGGGLFIPVKDALTSSATYGGGRYVIDTAKGADLGGDLPALVVDFNFAYNPSCAYDPFWACPLAPEGNVVEVELPVGELTGRDHFLDLFQIFDSS